jgi:hypothetical protein
MGQYYLAIILADKEESKPEVIRIFMEMFGSKLTEHSYLENPCVKAFEYQLTKEGMFYKSRVVWAGDYADKEPELEKNLYHITEQFPNKFFNKRDENTTKYQYIINHTKKQFIDKENNKSVYHPLPLLTAEGNGRGGGDYSGVNENLIGIWARDVISVEKDKPEGYEEFINPFNE